VLPLPKPETTLPAKNSGRESMGGSSSSLSMYLRVVENSRVFFVAHNTRQIDRMDVEGNPLACVIP
jgi:hypothetical protein